MYEQPSRHVQATRAPDSHDAERSAGLLIAPKEKRADGGGAARASCVTRGLWPQEGHSLSDQAMPSLATKVPDGEAKWGAPHLIGVGFRTVVVVNQALQTCSARERW